MKYFKHETSDRNKLPSKLIRNKFGAEGYGIYMSLLEVIGEEIEKDNPHNWGYVNAMHTIETLADECATTPEKLMDFLKFCDEKGIFERKHKRLYSALILSRVDEYTDKIMKKSGQTPDKVPTHSRQSPDSLRPNRIEQNRREQKRREQNKNNGEKQKTASPENDKLVPRAVLGIDADTVLKPKKNGISKEWQDKAFRYAKYLGISLSDNSLKSRWFKFVRDGQDPKMQTTVSYLTDYPPFRALKNDEERVKYFFGVYYDKT